MGQTTVEGYFVVGETTNQEAINQIKHSICNKLKGYEKITYGLPNMDQTISYFARTDVTFTSIKNPVFSINFEDLWAEMDGHEIHEFFTSLLESYTDLHTRYEIRDYYNGSGVTSHYANEVVLGETTVDEVMSWEGNYTCECCGLTNWAAISEFTYYDEEDDSFVCEACENYDEDEEEEDDDDELEEDEEGEGTQVYEYHEDEE